MEWRAGGLPVSTRFDDPYFNIDNGFAETEHVFLEGNRLSDRFCPGFHIAELGFGTGLNLLAALLAWRRSGQSGKFRFTTFEAYPMQLDQMTRAHAAFADVAQVSKEIAEVWPQEETTFETDDVVFTMIVGDVRETLPLWSGRADAWFLDGFSPAKNPQMWEPEVMKQVFEHTHSGGTAATYTAAGFVRRGLSDAGFTVTRHPGYGRKRHMTRAQKGHF